jgi:hypothetical protein
MTSSPASRFLPCGKSSTPDGGNWTAHTHARPFLFMFQQFQKLLGQITDTARVAHVPGSVSAPAAPPHGLDPARVPQALPFSKVNHVAHVDGSPSVGRTEVNRSAVA